MHPKTKYLSVSNRQELHELLNVHYASTLDKTLNTVIKNAIYSAHSREQIAEYLRDAVASLEVTILVVESYQQA